MALLGLAYASPAFAQETAVLLTEEVAAPFTAQGIGVPAAGRGDWAERVQLVWDQQTGQLERRRFEAWNPYADETLTFEWQPTNPETAHIGTLSGLGRLAWRTRSDETYEEGTILAIYEGTFADGRLHGTGRFEDRSGTRYEGEWRNGLMHGLGRLELANGDVFSGTFRAGRLHGTGTYMDGSGSIYRGRFVAQLVQEPVHVLGVLGGGLLEGELEPGNPFSDTLFQITDADAGHEISVHVDRNGSDFGREDWYPDPVRFVGRLENGQLIVEPEDKQLMAVWKGDGNMLTNVSTLDSGFLGSDLVVPQAHMILSYENTGTQPIELVGGFLDVSESRADNEPAMNIYPYGDIFCPSSDEFNNTAFLLSNYGWSSLENASLVFALADRSGTPRTPEIELPLGEIDHALESDLAPAITDLGFDVGFYSQNTFSCPDLNNDLECAAHLRETGQLGEIGDAVWVQAGQVVANAKGQLVGQWRDYAGNLQDKRVQFQMPVWLGTGNAVAECGEGGDIISASLRDLPFILRPGQSDYRLPMVANRRVEPGQVVRLRAILLAPQSSQHSLRFVLQTAAGETLSSPDVEFTYFINHIEGVDALADLN